MKSFRSILVVSLLAIGAAAAPPAHAQMFYMTTSHDMRSSKLVGMTVYNERNEKIGTIDEILLPAAGGEVTAVLSVGGFLGIGEKMIRVPLSHVHFAGDKPMMPGDKAALMAMPKYSYGFGGGGGG